jgi:hypothetical protein
LFIARFLLGLPNRKMSKWSANATNLPPNKVSLCSTLSDAQESFNDAEN